MASPDDPTRETIAMFARAIEQAVDGRLECAVLYGSAAADDWVAGRSDVNVAVVVTRATPEVLEALATVITRWRDRGIAVPLVLDREFLASAIDVYPVELDEIRRRHRLLLGDDLFARLTVDPAALRLECEREARGKLLRLRALFLCVADRPDEVAELMHQSLKTFLTLLRHYLRLRGESGEGTYADVLAGAEGALGPLPTMHRVLAHRLGDEHPAALRAGFPGYLLEVERIVAALDALHA
jgi:predicted nucleotidyltransferase